MRADIFVHPDFYAQRHQELPRCYTEYELAMQEAYDQSNLPILAYDPNKGPVQSRFNWERLFDDSFKIPTKESRGEPESSSDIQKMILGLSGFGISEVIIHGSYLEVCVNAFIYSIEQRLGRRVTHGKGFSPAIWRLPELEATTSASLGHVLSWDPFHLGRNVRPSDIADSPDPFNPNLDAMLEGYMDKSTRIYQLPADKPSLSKPA